VFFGQKIYNRLNKKKALSWQPKQLDYTMLATTLLFLAEKWMIFKGQQMSLDEMMMTAETMMRNNEKGAVDIVDCLQKIDRMLLFTKAL